MNFGAELKESRLALMETSQRAKCSRNPSPRPPPVVSMGTEPGRRSPGAAAAADVACAGLAWGGGRGGAAPGSRALGRGRPRAGYNNEPGAGVRHLQEAS